MTQSLYKRGKQIFYDSNVDSRIIDFVRERIAEWQPHEAFVIDVCETSQGPRIVELNTINSSAFYAANLQLLVNALAEVRLSNH